jgi:5,5'-dehydrodivanillate O-demethylase oxygenase subunit
VPREREPYVQGPIPTWHGPIKDAHGHWISSHVINQDIIAWVGQGTIADRGKEHLGASDVGIVMMRKRFLDELAAVAKGAEPKGIIRDPNVARCVELPNMEHARCVEGVTAKDFETIPILKARLQGFRWQYGQPPEVRRAFEAAIGIGPSVDK